MIKTGWEIPVASRVTGRLFYPYTQAQKSSCMAVRLFNLRHVPEDEADDIRRLLEERGFDYYETPPGNWGISAATIWLKNPEDLPRAKQLIEEYEEERSKMMRQQYANKKEAGETESLIERFLAQPVQFVLYILIILVILYISTRPFINFGQ